MSHHIKHSMVKSTAIKGIAHHAGQDIMVSVECHLSNGLPVTVIVGLGSKAVDEAKERIRSAFSSSGIPFPKRRITINLAPADIPKTSTGLDLAIAVAIIQATSPATPTTTDEEAFIGELGLDGSIRPVRGVIGALIAAAANGIKTFYIPRRNTGQANLIPGIRIIPLDTLNQYIAFRQGGAHRSFPAIAPYSHEKDIESDSGDKHLSLIAGQVRAKRALCIAAAGGHNIFLSGPPGTGKTMLAKALPSLLPPMSTQEILEVTHLHSLASITYENLITCRPFRAPHHSASYVSLVGGGAQLRPGEISLSHRGVLFLDEMPEFSRRAIEALRQPLEDNVVTIARAREVAEFPANFMLVATANPCPCGYYGTSQPCICMPHAVMQYRQKISGPIMDRFDLYIESEPISHSALLEKIPPGSRQTAYGKQISRARDRQHDRYILSGNYLNSDLTNKLIRSSALLETKAAALLNVAAQKLTLSARAYMRTIKVARTIADMEDSRTIKTAHISEALQYRSQNQSSFL